MMHAELGIGLQAPGLFAAAATCVAGYRRIITTLRASQNARKLLSHGTRGFSASSESVALIPIRNEPEAATRAAKYWRDQRTCWYIVTSSDEDPPLTLMACRGESAHVIETAGRSKAAMLNEALATLATTPNVTYALLFDSDSRPMGNIVASGNSDYLVCASIYVPPVDTILARGCALWQSVWSLGFELHMPNRRLFWYLVGHGIGIRVVNKQPPGFRTDRGTEDLDFGYRLSATSATIEQVDAVDRCEWAGVLNDVLAQVGRWFWGDVEATAGNLSCRPLHASIRLLELIVTWMLGPWLIVVALAMVIGANPLVGLPLAGAMLLVTMLPAAVMPKVTFDFSLVADSRLLRHTGVRRVSLVPGLLARPFLDSYAIVRHLLMRGAGTARRVTPKHGGLDACI